MAAYPPVTRDDLVALLWLVTSEDSPAEVKVGIIREVLTDVRAAAFVHEAVVASDSPGR